jgi:hypothetical protein
MQGWFKGGSTEDRIQQRCMELNMYEVWITDEADKVGRMVTIEELTNLGTGIRAVMRVIMDYDPMIIINTQQYRCPFCKTWNDPSNADSLTIDW